MVQHLSTHDDLWRTGRVVEIIPETARTRSIVLSISDWPGHRPGQYVDVRLPATDGTGLRRSYSIASPPEDDDRITLTVGMMDNGQLSPYLASDLGIGDRLDVRGPRGDLFTWTVDDGGPLLLIAGGSGITPLMAMLRHHAARGSDIPVTLLYSARSPGDVIYRDELERLAAGGNRRIVYTLTRQQPDGWTGFSRRIDGAMLREVIGAPKEQTIAAVCGPTAMVEAVVAVLLDVGFGPDQIRTERFRATGTEQATPTAPR